MDKSEIKAWLEANKGEHEDAAALAAAFCAENGFEEGDDEFDTANELATELFE